MVGSRIKSEREFQTVGPATVCMHVKDLFAGSWKDIDRVDPNTRRPDCRTPGYNLLKRSPREPLTPYSFFVVKEATATNNAARTQDECVLKTSVRSGCCTRVYCDAGNETCSQYLPSCTVP